MPDSALASLWTTPNRRPAAADPGHEARQRHIRAVALLESGRWTGEQVMALERISRDTLYRWRARVLRDYDDPEAVGLRRLLGRDRVG